MQHQKYDSITTSVQERDQSEEGGHRISAKKTTWDKLMQTWALELAGFLVGLGSLTTAVVLLGKYDNQPIPELPLTINVLLSLIGNVGFAGTMFGIHSSAAQLKWIWFSKVPRPLADFAGFQRAGGPIGIIHLLFFTTGAQ